MATEDTFVTRGACEPAMEWIRQQGFTTPSDAVTALEIPEWIGWIAKRVDTQHESFRGALNALRNEALSRLPLDFPERPLLVAYLTTPTQTAKDTAWSAYRSRKRDIETAQRTEEWTLVEAILDSPFALERVIGQAGVLAILRANMDLRALGDGWVAKYGA